MAEMQRRRGGDANIAASPSTLSPAGLGPPRTERRYEAQWEQLCRFFVVLPYRAVCVFCLLSFFFPPLFFLFPKSWTNHAHSPSLCLDLGACLNDFLCHSGHKEI